MQKKKDGVFICGAIIITLFITAASYCYLDKPLSLYIYTHAVSQSIPGLELTHYLGKNLVILGSVGLFILYSYGIKHSKLKVWQGLFIFCSVLLSNVVVGALKVVLGRARPMQWINYDIFGFYGFSLQGDYWSFPSGHTVSVVSAVVSLSIVWPKWRYVFMIIGLGLIFSRVLLLKHFLSDIIVGTLIGFLISWCLYHYFFQYKINFAKNLDGN